MQAKCPSCGAINPPGKVLCISCGKALVHASGPSTRPSEPPAYQTAPPMASLPSPPPAHRSPALGPSTGTTPSLQGYWSRFLEKPENWFAAALILFFVPFAGMGIWLILPSCGSDRTCMVNLLQLVYLLLVPILAIVTIVMSVSGRETRIIGLAAGIVPLVVQAVMLLRFRDTIWQGVEEGAYLDLGYFIITIFAAIGMILAVLGIIKKPMRR